MGDKCRKGSEQKLPSPIVAHWEGLETSKISIYMKNIRQVRGPVKYCLRVLQEIANAVLNHVWIILLHWPNLH